MRDFGVRDKTITSPEQMKGVRVRVMDSPVFLESFRALCQLVGIPFPELYTALQQGAVDMQENPIPTSVMMKFTEVAKHLTHSGHSLTCLYKMVSMPVWESLTPSSKRFSATRPRSPRTSIAPKTPTCAVSWKSWPWTNSAAPSPT